VKAKLDSLISEGFKGQ